MAWRAVAALCSDCPDPDCPALLPDLQTLRRWPPIAIFHSSNQMFFLCSAGAQRSRRKPPRAAFRPDVNKSNSRSVATQLNAAWFRTYSTRFLMTLTGTSSPWPDRTLAISASPEIQLTQILLIGTCAMLAAILVVMMTICIYVCQRRGKCHRRSGLAEDALQTAAVESLIPPVFYTHELLDPLEQADLHEGVEELR